MEYDVTFEFKTEVTVRVKGEGHDDAYGEAECQLCEVFDTGRWTEEVKLALAQAVMNRADAEMTYDRARVSVSPLVVVIVRMEPA